MIDIPEEQLVKKGKMTKAPWTMAPEEYKSWKIQKQAEAKEYLFSIGQPFVFEKDGKMYAEYAGGRIDSVS